MAPILYLWLILPANKLSSLRKVNSRISCSKGKLSSCLGIITIEASQDTATSPVAAVHQSPFLVRVKVLWEGGSWLTE